jgi:cysteine-rich repeat protein
MNTEKKKDEYCSEGYREEYYYFCIDKCGDGSVKMNSRMLECDDGNEDDGDG